MSRYALMVVCLAGLMAPSLTRAQEPGPVFNPADVDRMPQRIGTVARHPVRLEDGQAGGELAISAVVGADGSVSDIAVVKSISTEQDARFVETVRNTRFEPAIKDDMPVAVRMTFFFKVTAINRWPKFSFQDKRAASNWSLVPFQF